MRRIDDHERRARLARRHALVDGVPTVADAAQAVVGLHSTDPSTTFLSALARTRNLRLSDVASALYDQRSVVRVLAMRRTVFTVPTEQATMILGAARGVADAERRKLLKLVADNSIDAPEAFLAQAEAEALRLIDDLGSTTAAEVAAASELLARRLTIGTGRLATQATVASRLFLVLACDGQIVRGRPRGGWTSTQFTWARADHWHPELAGPLPDVTEAAAGLAEAWLRHYGPATIDDLQWWTGWTKTLTRRAVAALHTVDVELDAGPGLVLADDVDPVDSPDPWVALLPALDPSVMSYRHRHHLVGDLQPQLFDTYGNAGATVWVDGQVVGGWTQLDHGDVAIEVLRDVGSEARSAIDTAAGSLSGVLGDIRLSARARRWSPLETRLRASSVGHSRS